MPTHCFRLVMLAIMLTLTPATACPEFCVCFDGTFVTCSNFKLLDLALLPPGIDTLSLSAGEVDELTPGFLAMATNLKMLEITSLNVRVVRGGAFRGLSNLERFAISESSFDIIEPDSFSGMSDIQDFLISQCKFGRIGKHAFSFVSGIIKFAIWSSTIETISEEAFYKMSEVLTFQMYKNNITSMGKDIFSGVSEIDDVTIYNNNIDHLAEGSIEKLVDTASRFLFYANNLVCSCELAWALNKEQMQDYLSTNRCVFPGDDSGITLRERTFRLSDLTLGALCVDWDQSKSTTETTKSSPIPEDTASRSEDSENGYDDTTTLAPVPTSLAETAGNSFVDEFLIIESVDLDNLPTQKEDADDNTESTVTQDIRTQEISTDALNTVSEVGTSQKQPTEIERETTRLIQQGIEVNTANLFPTEKIITLEETHLRENEVDTSELFTSLSTTTEASSPQSKELSHEEDTIASSPHLPLDPDASDANEDPDTNLTPEDAISTEDSLESTRGGDTSYALSGEWDEDQDKSATDPTRYGVAKDNVALAVSDPVDEGDAHKDSPSSRQSEQHGEDDDDSDSSNSRPPERRAKAGPNNSAERHVARITGVMASLCCLLGFLNR
ncbi:unnamed protein product [Lymnaea stagnalis]|uniref:Uncharacterized protein n=1 Tax=Lymnaea stagnalis TaxID=6523 RepID=A0AAV2H7W7_LYMST